jgi:hypothetical protein
MITPFIPANLAQFLFTEIETTAAVTNLCLNLVNCLRQFHRFFRRLLENMVGQPFRGARSDPREFRELLHQSFQAFCMCLTHPNKLLI